MLRRSPLHYYDNIMAPSLELGVRKRGLYKVSALSNRSFDYHPHSLHRMPVSTLTLNDGNKVPWIAFGTGTALYRKDVQHAVTLALQSGFIHLDGAQEYRNEETLGAAIAASGKPRSELFVTTKLGGLEGEATPKSALEVSLRKLGLNHVDLYLVHHAHVHINRLKEVWKGMEEARNAGLTKSIGVSNFTVDHLREILEVATIPPAVNQVKCAVLAFRVAHPY